VTLGVENGTECHYTVPRVQLSMRKLLLPVLLFAAAALAPAADTTSLAGKWNLHSSISGYEGDLACTFTQTGTEIGGTCKGEQGDVSVTGKLEDKQVTLQYKTEYNGDELTIIYKGKFDSDSKITGGVTVDPMGVEGEFTATQSK